MKKIIYLLLFMITSVSAQKDTLYFNAAWNKTSKANAVYYRPMPLKKVGNLFQVKDFYASGKLQMDGFWSNVENEVLEGKITWYYENGKPFQEQEYINGSLNGISTFYTAEGFLRAKGQYRKGKMWTGTFQKLCCPGAVSEYKEGQKTADLTFYQASAQLAKKELFINKAIGEIHYFDKQGKRIGQITYKDNEAVYGTFIHFYMDNNQATRAITIKSILSYKNGIKDGSYKEYSRSGKLLKEQEYKNGKLSGLSKTTGAFKNKTCECEFKNELPFSGEVCEDFQIKKYNLGALIQKELYADGAATILKYKTLYQDNTKIKQIAYVKNETYEINYKEGAPFNGVDYRLDTKGMTTYVNGEKHGIFSNNVTPSYFIKTTGNFKNGNYDGTIIFTDTRLNKNTRCTYANGKPLNGITMLNGFVTSYKNGKKQGLETSLKREKYASKNYDSIARKFKNDQLDGAILFFKKSSQVAVGAYKKGIPFDGDIFITPNTKNGYSNGILVTSNRFFKYNDYQQKTDYSLKSNGKDGEEILRLKGDTIAIGRLVNNKPWEGQFGYFDEEEYPGELTLISFKNGKKHGLKQVFTISDNTLLQQVNYKKDAPVDALWAFPFKDKPSIKGNYKKGKPYNGLFYTEKDIVASVEHYEKGIKKGWQYYATKSSKMQRLLDSVSYIKGDPFQGGKIEEVESRTIQHQYENGKKVTTNIYYFGLAKVPHIAILYAKDGFKTSVRTRKGLKEYSTVHFDNVQKSKGKVYFLGGAEKGELKFADGKITSFHLENQTPSREMKFYPKESNKFVLEIKDSLNVMKLHSEFTVPKTIEYTTFLYMANILTDGTGTVYCHMNDEKEPVSYFTIKKGKPFNGINVQQIAKGVFRYDTYKNGETIEKQMNLTKEQLNNIIQKKE